MADDRKNAPIHRTAFLTQPISDPGNAGAIDNTVEGVVNLVSAGAETRTLADPTYNGQFLAVSCDTHGGDIALTVAHAFDLTPHTVATFTAAGQAVFLRAATIAGALRWRLVANLGATLS